MNIDRLSPWYRWIEYAAFGRALERARFAYLDRLSMARRILILGEGDGRALARLLELAPQAQIDVVELSAAMIDLARGRIGGNSECVCFHQQNALGAGWPFATYDRIITHFFLDCFSKSDAFELTHRIVAAMRPGAVWLVTDFAIPNQGWRHWHAVVWIQMMYAFFRATTGLRTRNLPPIDEMLVEAGLQRLKMIQERGGLIQSEIWMKYADRGPDA